MNNECHDEKTSGGGLKGKIWLRVFLVIFVLGVLGLGLKAWFFYNEIKNHARGSSAMGQIVSIQRAIEKFNADDSHWPFPEEKKGADFFGESDEALMGALLGDDDGASPIRWEKTGNGKRNPAGRSESRENWR